MDLIDVLFFRALIVPVLGQQIGELSDEKADVTAVPSEASVNATGGITFQNSDGDDLFSVQLPLYAGGVE